MIFVFDEFLYVFLAKSLEKDLVKLALAKLALAKLVLAKFWLEEIVLVIVKCFS